MRVLTWHKKCCVSEYSCCQAQNDSSGYRQHKSTPAWRKMGIVCVEVLLATIFVWISLFGIVELAINQIQEPSNKLAAYICLLIPVMMFACLHDGFTSCILL